ncbi:3-oxoacyl-ACP reductase family protein [Pantoea sp. UYEF8]|uniref:SDR family NAD(P)-dependent oxidoreductase n=1 Tax=Pantoea sp. UYEF8 TaxID=1756394 RepID=UPI0033946419
MRLLDGKNVFITGASKGIGWALAQAFAENGANIFAHSRSEDSQWQEALECLAKKNGVTIWPCYFDMTDYAAMKKALNSIKANNSSVDILINNAGVMTNALFQMTTDEMLRQQFEVNFFSIFMLTQYISRLMTKKNSGSIINISSVVAIEGSAGQSAYSAAKAAVIAFSKSIAAELGEKNIRVNCIAPGIIDTTLLHSLPVQRLEKTKNKTLLKRYGLPAEVASTAVFLASELAAYITGQVIRVDGGLK